MIEGERTLDAKDVAVAALRDASGVDPDAGYGDGDRRELGDDELRGREDRANGREADRRRADDALEGEPG
jgi:hypothetical protein